MFCRLSKKIARAVVLSMINAELEGSKKEKIRCVKDGRIEEAKLWDSTIEYLESIKKKY